MSGHLPEIYPLDPPDDPYEVRRRPQHALQDEARWASREAERARKTTVQRHDERDER